MKNRWFSPCYDALVVSLTLGLICLFSTGRLSAQETEWTPGLHLKLPSVVEPKRTFSVYIPSQYQQDNEFGFPTLCVSSPGGNPNLKEYTKWADKNDFILIGINSSKNGPSENNIQAQELCLETVNQTKLNRHRHLNFSTGHSGGAQASWLLATRRPVEFAGILLTGQSGHTNLPPKHISVTYVYGEKEHNRDFIESAIKKLKANGNPVRSEIVPGGHVPGPFSVRGPMLDWMYNNAFTYGPGVSDGERIAKYDSYISAADEIVELEQRMQRYQQLLNSPLASKSELAAQTLTKWQTQTYQWANESAEETLKLKRLYELQKNPLFKKADSYQELRETVAEMGKDKTLQSEYKAVKILVKARAAQAKAKDARKMQSVLRSYETLVKKYPDTLSAEDAKAAIALLRPPASDSQ